MAKYIVTKTYKADFRNYGPITVPVGAICTDTVADGSHNTNIRFWESFLRDIPGIDKNSMLAHDLTYYGLDVPTKHTVKIEKDTPATIKVRVHQYRFDISKDDQDKQYEKLCDDLKESEHKKFRVIVEYQEHQTFKEKLFGDKQAVEVLLDTSWISSANQWNTLCGLRIHDWFELSVPNRDLHTGYWIEFTEELVNLRATSFTCRFCGETYHNPEHSFCKKCLGNEYLMEKHLPLLTLTSCDGKTIMSADLAEIREAWRAAQIEGPDCTWQQKIKNRHARTIQNARDLIKKAKIEAEMSRYMLSVGLDGKYIENLIYYTHTGRFCIGWQTPLTVIEKNKINEAMKNCPHKFDLK